MSFQFHKVRLKEGGRGCNPFLEARFQFHKVRLKVFCFLGFDIGSVFQFHKVRLKVRVHFGHFLEIIGLFQFHKVRLKAWGLSGRCVVCSRFQFHKVRLKDPPAGPADYKRIHFNSIRYD